MSTRPTRARVVGVPVDAVDEAGALGLIDDWMRVGGTHVAVGVNANVCNLAARDARFRAQVSAAELCYADGQSIVGAARLLGHPVPERLATTDLVHPLAALAAARGAGMFLYGGRPGVAERAADRLRRENPGLQVDTQDGYLPRERMPELLERLERLRPGILLVGLGDPLQQDWIARNRDQLEVPAVLSCGGLFDWLAGENRRAPGWMIRAGLEWLWRLIIEPRRLARRYLLGNPAFLLRLGWQLATRRRAGS
ncbi:WecB/TagA/CpsF family glycosyltransferase [Schumannella sp. 10F1B-5-1]|uniref:WecB/TagA/CpsF family glycosyltransferase n=1 Tax=Schumannella sp. 10F1B-5-1 TaxID=2590780 RepID=UPI001131A631|nr:WecB/TagA/CpsF family glycosyltransferase [Schumannella sp. 10F1B-5-1]TPW73779.1 WecB/TagA/CpsF family glycosyltransferase [Schumannella sp. 10F1B-5-1]